jgi:hypothetical protein
LAWQAAGYTVLSTYDAATPNRDCTEARDDLVNLASTWTARTVVRVVGCRLDLSGSTMTLANDLAIVSDWGITFANRTIFRTGTPNAKQLHLIVPFSATCTSATGQGNIELHNNASIEPPIETFIYSPCTVKVANSGVLQGQVYGDSVQFTNLTTLAFRPNKGVPGYNSMTTSSMVRQVSVLYKREVVA